MSVPIHTRLEEVRAKDAEKYAWPRVMCGRGGAGNANSVHYLRGVPTCPECAVLRDLWLETMPRKKKPTVRRWRAWLKEHQEAATICREGDFTEYPAAWRLAWRYA